MTDIHIKHAKEVFAIESKSIADLAKLIDPNFAKAVNCILKSKGRNVSHYYIYTIIIFERVFKIER